MLVSGQMPLVGLLEWLQVLELNRRSVCLRLRRHGTSGWLRLVRGRLVEARCGAHTGDEAARHLLTWTDAFFEQERSLDNSPGTVTRPNYELMLSVRDEVSAVAATDPQSSVSGDLVVMSPAELLQLGELNQRRFTLRVHDDVEGKVCFDGGRIVGAASGEAVNEDAVYAILAARFGTFKMTPLEQPPATPFSASVQELLVEGVRRADEARLIRGEPVPDPDPTEGQLLEELAAGELSSPVRLAMAKRYQPRGEATPVPVLLRLVGDPEGTVRETAMNSILRLPSKIRRRLAEDPDAPAAIRERLAATPADGDDDEELPPDEEYPRGIHGRIHLLSMADKIYLARRGTRNERLILMRHPCRRVAIAALESNRTTETDIETIARSTSANPEVLAAIARDDRYNHKYTVVRSLVLNGKTPGEIGARLVQRLREADLRLARSNLDLPGAVRAAVQKRTRALEVKRRF